MKFDDTNSPFTTHEIKFLKDIGEYDNIMAGLAFVDAMKKLPKDLSKFLDRLDDEIPKDPKKASAALAKISQNDPEFFEQILAYSTLLSDLKPQEKRVEKVSVKQEKEQNRAETYEILMKKIKSI